MRVESVERQSAITLYSSAIARSKPLKLVELSRNLDGFFLDVQHFSEFSFGVPRGRMIERIQRKFRFCSTALLMETLMCLQLQLIRLQDHVQSTFMRKSTKALNFPLARH